MGQTPLFPVELAHLSRARRRALAVEAFADSWARTNIWEGFNALLLDLERIGVPWDIYVDGSFVTDKRSPGDIDLLLVARTPPTGYSQAQIALLRSLNKNRDRVLRELRCDFQLLVETSEVSDLQDAVDQVLNLFVINEFGPPKRTIHIALPERS